MSFKEYIEAQRHNYQEVEKLPHFNILVGQIENIYNHTIKIFPSNVPVRFIRFLLLFHKSFISAATLIAQCQPDDAAPITRRAIEIARICLASKYDGDNYEKWLSYEKRYERWQKREQNEKPPYLPTIKLNLPDNHPIFEDLMLELGILSDAFVHFTPEYFSSLNWKDDTESEPPTINLSYFISDQKILKRELLIFVGCHAKFLQIIDECIDRYLYKQQTWKSMMASLYNTGSKLGKSFEITTDKEKP
jgi:hypothetical protein